jgi:hypothetical protein
MATGAGNVGYDAEGYISYDVNDEKKSDALYTGKITGINPTSQINPYVSNTNFAITSFNPDIENTSGAYWEPAAELKWYKNANNVLFQEKKELQIEIKVYKKIIKNLLKKK